MKKLLILSIVLIIGSVGFAFWKENKLVVIEAPWPEEILLTTGGNLGKIQKFVTMGKVTASVKAGKKSTVGSATFVIPMTETLLKTLGDGTTEFNRSIDGMEFHPKNQKHIRLLTAFKVLKLTERAVIKGALSSNGSEKLEEIPEEITNNVLLLFIAHSHLWLPDHPVKQGGTWSLMAPDFEDMEMNYELAGFENYRGIRCAKIKATGKSRFYSFNYETLFDWNNGIVLKVDKSLNGKMGGNEYNVTMTKEIPLPLVAK
jgi:hypothetical protein